MEEPLAKARFEKYWPPREFKPEEISAEDKDALDVRLDTMARGIARNLDFTIEMARREGLTGEDELWYHEMTNPNVRVMRHWMTVIQQSRALLQATAGSGSSP